MEGNGVDDQLELPLDIGQLRRIGGELDLICAQSAGVRFLARCPGKYRYPGTKRFPQFQRICPSPPRPITATLLPLPTFQ